MKPLYVRALPWLVLWIVLSWFIGTWLKLTGADLWILRGGLALLGVTGFLGILWYLSRRGADLPKSSGGGDIDSAIKEAETKLRASGIGKISELPAFVLLGDSGSAKTSILLQSGLDPEILSGLAQRDGNVLPTQALNLWVGKRNLFIDAAGAMLQDRNSRQHLIRKLESFGISTIVGRAEPAPRAVIVCVPCDMFLTSGAAAIVENKAREIREMLSDLSEAWKVRLPVYVLFTKLDRLSHFTEYAGNLDDNEVLQTLGYTLPMDVESAGTYAQRETMRLTEAFQDLASRLRDRRLDLLEREHSDPRLPAVYEFPREFGKLRLLLVQFLVDLCRPSQLHVNPFLRGFYFTGVRPVAVNDVAPAPVVAATNESFDANATQVFSLKAQRPAAQVSRPGTTRKPQWVFLAHLLPSVILGDRLALGSSRTSTKAGVWQRALLAAAAAASIAMMILWTMSFSGNYSLSSRVVAAATALKQSATPLAQPPSGEVLSKLENLKQPLVELMDYEKNGHPTSLGWGLYSGSSLIDPAYRAYFTGFRPILLAQTTQNITAYIGQPTQDSSFQDVYDGLKAYLITTSHPDKSTAEFLPPVLTRHLRKNQPMEQASADLAQKQFLFYSQQLPTRRAGLPVQPETETITRRARAFLNASSATAPIYARMLAAVSAANPSFIFRQQYPGSEETVQDTYEVKGAFTKVGWTQMSARLKDPREYFSGEEWVLGPDVSKSADRARMQQELEALYQNDFIRTWREFLKAGRVVRYGSVGDAADKLLILSGNRSPLLSLLCEVSEHTSVEAKIVADQFKPPQQVTPPGCRQLLLSAANQPYGDGLTRLQTSLTTLKNNTTNEILQNDAISSAGFANNAVSNLARTFPVDKEGALDTVTQNLMRQPIQYAESTLGAASTAEVNGAGKGLCLQLAPLLKKFPFAAESTTQATAQEVGDFFRPGDGLLWKFYEDFGKKLLSQQGSDYVAKPGAKPAATPAFATFFSRAAAVSGAFFPNNARDLQLAFSLRSVASEDVQKVELNIGQQNLRGGTAAQRFAWPDPSGKQNIELKVTFTGGTPSGFGTLTGPWAIFTFFARGENWSPASGNKAAFERTAYDGRGREPLRLPNGHAQTARFEVDTANSPLIYRPGYFTSLTCPSPAVRP